jgi:hypothetical protein
MPPLFFRKLVQRIREEFENAPDLRVTVGEAARFFALDCATSARVLSELARSGSVTRGVDQRYRLREESGSRNQDAAVGQPGVIRPDGSAADTFLLGRARFLIPAS